MSYSTTVGVVSGRGKELSNRSLTRKKFAEFLGKQKPSLVAFESCATAHYWARAAKRHGHEARITPAKAVAPFRQGHKTDSNDALAVAEAARRPKIKEAPMKTVPEILEDGENELPDLYRPTLHRMYNRLLELREDIGAMTKEVERLAKAHPICNKLMALEGVGPISALLLYATMGSGAAFSGSREFAAYLGLAPKQYSSGGKTNIVGLSKKIGNSQLRSVLILGARAYVYKLKEPKSSKDKWLQANVERNGESRATVALANKNVRTAWAMVTQGTEYQRR